MAIQLGSAYGKIHLDSSGVKKGVDDSRKALGGFGDKALGVSRMVTGAVAGIAASALVMKKAFDFGKEGAQLDYAREKFDRLAESIGTTGDALMRDLKSATRGLVADSVLVASAGDLMALGLAKTHEEAVRLTKVAGALGMNMNQLVLTLTNQTTMRFDALGVSVDGFKEKVKELEEAGYDANEAFKMAFLAQAEEQLALVGDIADQDAGSFARFEASVQNLEDRIKTGLYPTLLRAVDAANLLLTANQKITDALAEHNQVMKESADSYKEYIEEMTRAAVVAGMLTEEDRALILSWAESGRTVDDLARSTDMYDAGLVGLITNLGLLTEQEWEAVRVGLKREERMEALQDRATRYYGALYKVRDAAKEAEQAQKDLDQAMSDLNDMIGGRLGPEADDFNDTQRDLATRAQELRTKIKDLSTEKFLTDEQKIQLADMRDSVDGINEKIKKLEDRNYLTDEQKIKLENLREKADLIQGSIRELEGRKYLTEQQKGELEGLKEELGEVEAQIGENAEAHDRATKEILFDILQQRLAVAGLTGEELAKAQEALLLTAEKWGLIDEDTRIAMQAADEFWQSLDAGTRLSGQKIDLLGQKMRGLPTAHTFTITIKENRVKTSEPGPDAPVIYPEEDLDPGQVPGGARGLHGFIPPGYPDDSYLVAATSGERVDIWPQGQGSQGEGGGGNQVFNQHFYNAGAAALGMAFVESMRGKRLDASMGR